jgi:flagellar biosynthesis GTPase FlhF
MHLKPYRRETVKDALRAVREELGPNALVLSTRTVTATGVRGLIGKGELEITAAAERHEMPEDRHQPLGAALGPGLGPGQRFGMLAADGFRVGAIEQLRLYADILGSPFATARTPDEFPRAIDAVRRPLLVDTAGRFADARPTRVVLTRLDEAESIGSLVSVLRERGERLSYFGSGQHVPADLQRATSPAVAHWITGEITTGAIA